MIPGIRLLITETDTYTQMFIYMYKNLYKSSKHRFTRSELTLIKTLIMVKVLRIAFWAQLSLVLSFVMSSHQDQSKSAGTLLTSLTDLVIDNSRATATFNSTSLRTLIALASNRKGVCKYLSLSLSLSLSSTIFSDT